MRPLHALIDALKRLHDVKGLIEWGGLTMICLIVCVETGLFVDFFLPGDSLLVTAGVFARVGALPDSVIPDQRRGLLITL